MAITGLGGVIRIWFDSGSKDKALSVIKCTMGEEPGAKWKKIVNQSAVVLKARTPFHVCVNTCRVRRG